MSFDLSFSCVILWYFMTLEHIGCLEKWGNIMKPYLDFSPSIYTVHYGEFSHAPLDKLFCQYLPRSPVKRYQLGLSGLLWKPEDVWNRAEEMIHQAPKRVQALSQWLSIEWTCSLSGPSGYGEHYIIPSRSWSWREWKMSLRNCWFGILTRKSLHWDTAYCI